MVLLLYFLNVVCSSGQSVLIKHYAAGGGKNAPFNICRSFSAFVIFMAVALIAGFSIHIPTILLGVIYGLMLCGSMYTGFKALALGPMSLTGTIASFSLIVPVLFGLCFLREKLSVIGVIGIVLLLVSIVLINYKKGGEISVKWSVFSVLTLLFNGLCSVIQKIHQIRFPALYRNEFMVWAMLTTWFVLVTTSLFQKEQRKKMPFTLLGVISGAMNGIANYIVLYLAALENATVLFPIVSAANTVAVWLHGRFMFKEKLTPSGIIGLVMGIAAVVLLKIN